MPPPWTVTRDGSACLEPLVSCTNESTFFAAELCHGWTRMNADFCYLFFERHARHGKSVYWFSYVKIYPRPSAFMRGHFNRRTSRELATPTDAKIAAPRRPPAAAQRPLPGPLSCGA
jgi:hypothetical protein